MFEWLTLMTTYHHLFLFSGAAAALDQRRPGAGCPTGGSQGVGKQGEDALELDPPSPLISSHLVLVLGLI